MKELSAVAHGNEHRKDLNLKMWDPNTNFPSENEFNCGIPKAKLPVYQHLLPSTTLMLRTCKASKLAIFDTQKKRKYPSLKETEKNVIEESARHVIS